MSRYEVVCPDCGHTACGCPLWESSRMHPIDCDCSGCLS